MINFYKVIKLLRGKQYYLQILKCTFLLPPLLWLKLNIYITFGASPWPSLLFLSLLCFSFGVGQLVLQKIADKSKIQVVQSNIHKELKLTQAMK